MFVQTFTGRRVAPFDLKPDDIDLSDIAHALAYQCRFNGHTSRFYSVAEHSLRVAAELEKELWPANVVLAALLHDASEAYVGDITRPIKAHLRVWVGDGLEALPSRGLVTFREIEDHVHRAIAARFGCRWPWPDAIHQADEQLLADEGAALLGNVDGWNLRATPRPLGGLALGPEQAEALFLERALELHHQLTTAGHRMSAPAPRQSEATP